MTELIDKDIKRVAIKMLNMFKKKHEHDEKRNGICKKEPNQRLSNIKMHWMGLTIDWIMKKKKKKISEL